MKNCGIPCERISRHKITSGLVYLYTAQPAHLALKKSMKKWKTLLKPTWAGDFEPVSITPFHPKFLPRPPSAFA